MSQTSQPDGIDPWADWPSQAAPGYGQTAPGYGDAAPGYGEARYSQATPGYGDAAHGYGDAGYGQTAPGYGEARYSQATPGYGEARYGQATPAYSQDVYRQPRAYEPSTPPGHRATTRMADTASPILVEFAAPARQRRLTVLLRGLLAIPHLVLLYALVFALEVVALIGWFVALFTGRLPAWAHAFSTGVLRWQTRVYAYLLMVTDVYPPFSLDDDAYPVRLVARQAKLSRAAVLFRILLAVPAAIVAGVAGTGLALLSFFAWLIALVTGRLPAALHQGSAAIIRYLARYYGFFFMVTDKYPTGLYGDSRAPGLSVVPDGGAGIVADYAPDGTDGGWRLALSGGAKALVTIALVLGIAAAAGSVILGVTLSRSIADKAANRAALTQADQANHVLGTSMTSFPAAVQACGGQLECVTPLDRKLGRSLETFANSIKALGVSGSAATPAASVVVDASAAAKDLNQLGSATSVAEYQQYASNNTLQQDLNHLSEDYASLVAALGAS
ncbi:MAG TPA: DUF4389 domain-containing protein [Streptosporangiaceae bacterium]|nr:DUF4389 domain-containing protein [Streptosporangiaceae bacterium]